MTEKLKTLMDESAQQQFAAPDLDAIVRAGDRTVRRRRLAVGAAGLAAAAVVATGVVLVTGDGSGTDNSQVADHTGTLPVDVLTWSWDDAFHTAEATYPVGHPIKAYVRTSAGYAFTDGEGKVFSFVDGEVAEIGSIDADNPRLVADDEGSLVGWVDPSGGELSFVAYDLADGTTSRFGSASAGTGTLADEEDPFYLYAIDGRTAYVHDSDGAVAHDVDTGEERVIDANARNGFDIKGVENGVVAFAVDNQEDVGTILRSPDGGTIDLAPGWGGPAYFSPDGRWVALEGDKPEIYDATTGERVSIDIGGRPFGTEAEWLDNDTVVVGAAQKLVGPLQLLTCEVPAGTCSVVVPDLGMFDDLQGRLAVANGETTED